MNPLDYKNGVLFGSNIKQKNPKLLSMLNPTSRRKDTSILKVEIGFPDMDNMNEE
jgi:hypothetical protein